MLAPVMFLDLSHYVFHRFFAIQAWCKIRKQEFGDTPEGRQEFIDKFSKLFEDNLVMFKKKYKISWENFYFVKDTPRDNIWRMKHYPLYKKNRDERNIKFDPTVFTHVYDNIIPQMIARLGAKVLGYDTAEADDVIAILTRKIRRETPHRKVVIITNDNDYVQLIDECTIVVNCNKKELHTRFTEEELRNYILWKVIKGDDSDNIPSIDKKIGDKVALKLANDPSLLAARLASSSEIKEKFDMNNLLINFDMIPRYIIKGIEALAL